MSSLFLTLEQRMQFEAAEEARSAPQPPKSEVEDFVEYVKKYSPLADYIAVKEMIDNLGPVVDSSCNGTEMPEPHVVLGGEG